MIPGDVASFFASDSHCADVQVVIEESKQNCTVVTTVDGLATIDMARCQGLAMLVMGLLDCALVPDVSVSSDDGSLVIRVTAYARTPVRPIAAPGKSLLFWITPLLVCLGCFWVGLRLDVSMVKRGAQILSSCFVSGCEGLVSLLKAIYASTRIEHSKPD